MQLSLCLMLILGSEIFWYHCACGLLWALACVLWKQSYSWFSRGHCCCGSHYALCWFLAVRSSNIIVTTTVLAWLLFVVGACVCVLKIVLFLICRRHLLLLRWLIYDSIWCFGWHFQWGKIVALSHGKTLMYFEVNSTEGKWSKTSQLTVE